MLSSLRRCPGCEVRVTREVIFPEFALGTTDECPQRLPAPMEVETRAPRRTSLTV